MSNNSTLKMSFVGENSGVKTGSEDWEKDEPQCYSEKDEPQCYSEDPAGSPLEPGPSLPSMNFVHTSPKVKNLNPKKFSIHDQDHKVLVVDSGNLIAVPDKNYIRPEIFFALASSLSSASAEKGSPILLGVSKGEFCLSCDKDKGQSHPSLQLKKKKLMKLAALKESARRPFIFNRAQVGSRNMLESAAHPGWFICTSCNCNEPVGVTDKFENRKHIEFSFQPVCKTEMSPSEVSD
ncbi:interleukin-37 isoform X1 [Macaca fascicularis]|uniref:interleukin-37 isoform X1 n=1 Tax=Macaca fascicularis TaxID=9541 RepID=UPI0032B064CF